jgi:hypothetical protein
MSRLVWIHAGRKRITLVLSWHGSNYCFILFSLVQNIIYIFSLCIFGWFKGNVLFIYFSANIQVFKVLFLACIFDLKFMWLKWFCFIKLFVYFFSSSNCFMLRVEFFFIVNISIVCLLSFVHITLKQLFLVS